MRYERWDVYRQNDGGWSAVQMRTNDFDTVTGAYGFVPFDTRKEAQEYCNQMNGLYDDDDMA